MLPKVAILFVAKWYTALLINQLKCYFLIYVQSRETMTCWNNISLTTLKLGTRMFHHTYRHILHDRSYKKITHLNVKETRNIMSEQTMWIITLYTFLICFCWTKGRVYKLQLWNWLSRTHIPSPLTHIV